MRRHRAHARGKRGFESKTIRPPVLTSFRPQRVRVAETGGPFGLTKASTADGVGKLPLTGNRCASPLHGIATHWVGLGKLAGAVGSEAGLTIMVARLTPPPENSQRESLLAGVFGRNGYFVPFEFWTGSGRAGTRFAVRTLRRGLHRTHRGFSSRIRGTGSRLPIEQGSSRSPTARPFPQASGRSLPLGRQASSPQVSTGWSPHSLRQAGRMLP